MNHNFPPSETHLYINPELDDVDERTARGPLAIKFIAAIAALAALTGAETDNASSAQSVTSAEAPTYQQAPSTHKYEKTPQASSTEATPKEAVVSVKTEKGVLYINNKATFLTGIYGPLYSDMADVNWAVDSLGINTVIEQPTNMSEQDVASQGQGRYFFMSRTRPDMKEVTRYSNTVAASSMDEPETHGCPPSLNCNYPTIPNLPVFANYNGWISSHEMWGINATEVGNGLTVTAEDYANYIKNQGPSAIITQDNYFLSSGKFTVQEAISNSYNYMLAQVKTVQKINPNAVNGQYIETWPTTTANGVVNELQSQLTPQVVTAEAKGAMTGRGKAVYYWAKKGFTSPAVAADIKNLNIFIHQHADVLSAPDLDISSYQSDLVKWGGTTLTKKDGSVINTMKIMNTTDKPLTVQRDFPGLKNQEVTNLVDGQRTLAHNGKIKVTVPPQEWYVGSFEVNQPTKHVVAAQVHHPKAKKSVTLTRSIKNP